MMLEKFFLQKTPSLWCLIYHHGCEKMCRVEGMGLARDKCELNVPPHMEIYEACCMENYVLSSCLGIYDFNCASMGMSGTQICTPFA